MNQKSLEIWKQRIFDRKSSGLNVADWCKKNNLTKRKEQIDLYKQRNNPIIR